MEDESLILVRGNAIYVLTRDTHRQGIGTGEAPGSSPYVCASAYSEVR
jgi:hypothetical protein